MRSVILIFIAVVAVAAPARAQSTGLKAVEPKRQPSCDSLDAKQQKAFDTGGGIGGIFDWLGRK